MYYMVHRLQTVLSSLKGIVILTKYSSKAAPKVVKMTVTKMSSKWRRSRFNIMTIISSTPIIIISYEIILASKQSVNRGLSSTGMVPTVFWIASYTILWHTERDDSGQHPCIVYMCMTRYVGASSTAVGSRGYSVGWTSMKSLATLLTDSLRRILQKIPLEYKLYFPYLGELYVLNKFLATELVVGKNTGAWPLCICLHVSIVNMFETGLTWWCILYTLRPDGRPMANEPHQLQ